jgi:hypothetical protein
MNGPTDMLIPQTGGGPISIPTMQSSYKGACPGGSLKDMLASHDTYWGSFAKDTPFRFEDTLKMYELMQDYVSCHAAARTDVSFCDSLPGPAEKDGIKVSLDTSPSFLCRNKTTTLLFEAYLAGNIKGDSYCRLYLAGFDQADLARFSAPEFCEAASKGPENAGSFLLKVLGPSAKDAPVNIAKAFPAKENDCKQDQKCLLKFRIYSAVKSGRPNDCPAGYKAQCQALAGRSTAPCDKILQDMSKFYCDSVEKVKKLHGGYIGMSKEALAAEIDKTKAAKIEADSLKKQQESIQADVNKKAKKMMKSE